MRRIFLTALLSAAVLIGFSSCDQGLFQTNIFAGFESFESPSADNAEDLLGARDDDRFYDEIAGGDINDPDSYVSQVIDSLSDVTADDPAYQEANLMLADVYMAATGADEVFDEFNTQLVGFIETGEIPGEDLNNTGDLLKLFFDDTLTSDELSVQLQGLVEAASYLSIYGSTLADGTPDGVNPGDVAAQALLAGIVSAVVTENGGDVTTLADAIVNNTTDSLALPVGSSLTEILTNSDPDLASVVTAGLDLSALGL